MVQQIYFSDELPLEDLEKIGLLKNGKLAIDKDNLTAMLQGRRTDMIGLKNLNYEGLNIDRLDAKLSLSRHPNGHLELKLHPIFKKAAYPEFLSQDEADDLEQGKVHTMIIKKKDKNGVEKDFLVEFDKETNEFIVTEADKIIAPKKVNNVELTPEQIEAYKKGKVVELPDGTKFQMKNTDKKGIVSDNTALILSLLLDGGISYLLIKGLKLIDKMVEQKAADKNVGYIEALKEMRAQKETFNKTQNPFENIVNNTRDNNNQSNQHSRGYTRSGVTR